MKKISTGKQLRFPVLQNIEYISLYLNRNSVLEVDGSDVEGLTWREFQLYLGERLPVNSYHYSLKVKNEPAIHTGKIRAVAKTAIGKPNTNEINMNEDISKQFQQLKEALNKATSQGGVTFDMLLASTKQGYEAQATYLNQKITDLTSTILELKQDIKELESELDECEKENAKSTGLAQYLQIGEKIASVYLGGKTKTPVSLKESNTSDIPEQILQVLGVINWKLIDAESINRIAENIQKYLSILPKEYFKGL